MDDSNSTILFLIILNLKNKTSTCTPELQRLLFHHLLKLQKVLVPETTPLFMAAPKSFVQHSLGLLIREVTSVVLFISVSDCVMLFISVLCNAVYIGIA